MVIAERDPRGRAWQHLAIICVLYYLVLKPFFPAQIPRYRHYLACEKRGSSSSTTICDWQQTVGPRAFHYAVFAIVDTGRASFPALPSVCYALLSLAFPPSLKRRQSRQRATAAAVWSASMADSVSGGPYRVTTCTVESVPGASCQ